MLVVKIPSAIVFSVFRTVLPIKFVETSWCHVRYPVPDSSCEVSQLGPRVEVLTDHHHKRHVSLASCPISFVAVVLPCVPSGHVW